MRVKDIMTKSPVLCTPNTGLATAARKMCDHNCGEIPVVDDEKTMTPVGVITDRDITCRSVAVGKNPLDLKVSDCMTVPAITVTPETAIEDCCDIMAKEKIRRVPVIDKNGRICGIVSQADIALQCDLKEAGTVVREVSLAGS